MSQVTARLESAPDFPPPQPNGRAHHAPGRAGHEPPAGPRVDPAAELEFMRAMQEYKQRSGRMFPTWSEVLEVLRSLGYEKPAAFRVYPGGPSPVADAG